MTIDTGFYKKLFTLGFPIVIQSFVTSLLNIIDTFMISSLSSAAIAGVGTANKLYFLLHLFLFGTATGAGVLASQYWGSKDIKSIKKVLGMTLTLGLSGATLFTVGAVFFPAAIMRFFTPEATVIEEGVKYLAIIGFAYIATAISVSYAFILRTTHQVIYPVIISIIAIGINTFLNWILIFGNLGMDAMGVEGAAIATVIARIFEMVVLIIIVYTKKMPAAGKPRELFGWSKAFVTKFFKTALPVIANELIWAFGVTGYAMIYGRMGEVVMASMTISQTIEQIAFILFFGMSSAGAVMLGNALGANELDKASNYADRLIKMFFALGIVTAIALYFLSGYVVNIFNVELAVKETVRLTIRIFSLYIPVKVLNLLLIVGILRSGGDTIAAMLIDTVGVWGVGLPFGIIGALVFKWDIGIVFSLILCEEVFKVIVSLIRYKKRIWIKNIVNDENIEEAFEAVELHS